MLHFTSVRVRFLIGRSLLGVPCKEILGDIDILVTITHQYESGRMAADDRAVNELTLARSVGPYLRYPPEPKLAFGRTSPSKAVTGI